MPNGRFVWKEASENKALAEVSAEAALLFYAVIPHLDRDGLIVEDLIFSAAIPRRTNLAPHMDGMIGELVYAGLFVRYGDKALGEAMIHVPLSLRWNPPKKRGYYHAEAPSIYECPPGWARTPEGIQRVDDQPMTVSPPSRDQADDALAAQQAAMIKAYEAEFGTFNPGLIEYMDHLIAAGQGDRWVKAIEYSLERAQGSPAAYFNKIIKDWASPAAIQKAKKDAPPQVEASGLREL